MADFLFIVLLYFPRSELLSFGKLSHFNLRLFMPSSIHMELMFNSIYRTQSPLASNSSTRASVPCCHVNPGL